MKPALIHGTLPSRRGSARRAFLAALLAHALLIWLVLERRPWADPPRTGEVLPALRGGGGGGGGARGFLVSLPPTAPPAAPVSPPVTRNVPPPVPPTVAPAQPAPDPVAVAVAPAAPTPAPAAAPGTGTGDGPGSGTGSGGGDGPGTGTGAGAGTGPGAGGGDGSIIPPEWRFGAVPWDPQPPKELRGRKVQVTFWVRADGTVERTEVNPEIADAAYARAFDTVTRAYRFKPARTSRGLAVPATVTLDITLPTR